MLEIGGVQKFDPSPPCVGSCHSPSKITVCACACIPSYMNLRPFSWFSLMLSQFVTFLKLLKWYFWYSVKSHLLQSNFWPLSTIVWQRDLAEPIRLPPNVIPPSMMTLDIVVSYLLNQLLRSIVMSTYVYVCVSVCPEPYTRSLPNFYACCLWPWLGPPPAGWRNTKGKGQFWGFSSPLYGPYSGINFATNDRPIANRSSDDWYQCYS